jgi:hypothetical protein
MPAMTDDEAIAFIAGNIRGEEAGWAPVRRGTP